MTTPMTHAECQALLVDLVYGELAGPEAHNVEQHLAGCADCRAEHESLAGTRKLMRALPMEEPGASMERAVMAAARAAAEKTQEKKRPWWLLIMMSPSMALATGLVVVAGASWWALQKQGAPSMAVGASQPAEEFVPAKPPPPADEGAMGRRDEDDRFARMAKDSRVAEQAEVREEAAAKMAEVRVQKPLAKLEASADAPAEPKQAAPKAKAAHRPAANELEDLLGRGGGSSGSLGVVGLGRGGGGAGSGSGEVMGIGSLGTKGRGAGLAAPGSGGEVQQAKDANKENLAVREAPAAAAYASPPPPRPAGPSPAPAAPAPAPTVVGDASAPRPPPPAPAAELDAPAKKAPVARDLERSKSAAAEARPEPAPEPMADAAPAPVAESTGDRGFFSRLFGKNKSDDEARAPAAAPAPAEEQKRRYSPFDELWARATAARDRGDCATAVPLFRQAREAEPQNARAPAAALGEAQCEERLGHADVARSLYLEILRRWPSTSEALAARGALAPAPPAVPAAAPAKEQ